MRRRLRWDWIGLALGTGLGVVDTLTLPALGVDLSMDGRDATALVAAFFSTSFAAFGFVAGRLAMARAAARAAEETIRLQLEELERAQRRVIQQEKLAALGRVAAGIAHEVRNPLGVIRASASMLETRFDPADDARRASRFIVEEIDRLNALITAILTFARPAEPRLTEIAPEKIVDRALQLAHEVTHRRGLELVRRTPAPVPEIRADADLLAHVVYGLVMNACEMLDTGGRIELRVESDPATDGVVIEVADDGPGVDLEVAERVFEPFYTTKPEGTGLGLAIADRIVETHGGRLEVVSGHGAGAAGSGACFRLTLPRGGPPGTRAP